MIGITAASIGSEHDRRRAGPPDPAHRHPVAGGCPASEREDAVITAIVLIKTDVARIPEVAETVAALDGVSEVYSITGEYDLVAMVRVRRHEELAEVIPGRLNKVPGIAQTETHIAFQTYSQHDLEAAFSIGLPDAD